MLSLVCWQTPAQRWQIWPLQAVCHLDGQFTSRDGKRGKTAYFRRWALPSVPGVLMVRAVVPQSCRNNARSAGRFGRYRPFYIWTGNLST